MAADDRPREKFLQHGAQALSVAELLAVILRSGTADVPLMGTCHALASLIDDDPGRLEALDVGNLAQVKGIGEIKAISLLAALELGRRSLEHHPSKSLTDMAIESLIAPYFAPIPVPQYYLVLLNKSRELLATVELVTEKNKLPDLNNIIKLTVEAGAAEIVLCRNEAPLTDDYSNEENAYILQLDAAANMLKVHFRGLLTIRETCVPE